MGDETYLAHELLDLSISEFVDTRVNTIHFHPEVALDISPSQNGTPNDHLFASHIALENSTMPLFCSLKYSDVHLIVAIPCRKECRTVTDRRN